MIMWFRSGFAAGAVRLLSLHAGAVIMGGGIIARFLGTFANYGSSRYDAWLGANGSGRNTHGGIRSPGEGIV
jgi:hypothetical protein